MPTGKVKWFNPDKGFGFLSQDGGEDVYVHADALPAGTAATLKAGTRVEFGIAQGRKGEQALQVRILDAPPSVVRNVRNAQRRDPDEMVTIIENATRMLDDIKAGYEKGRHPAGDFGTTAARVLREIAKELEL